MAKRRKQVGKGYTRRMDDHKREQMKQQTRGKSKELEQLEKRAMAASAELWKAQQEAAAAQEAAWAFENQWQAQQAEIERLRAEIIHSRIVWFAYGMGAALVAVGAVLMWRGW